MRLWLSQKLPSATVFRFPSFSEVTRNKSVMASARPIDQLVLHQRFEYGCEGLLKQISPKMCLGFSPIGCGGFCSGRLGRLYPTWV
jgi:hypothetical protein